MKTLRIFTVFCCLLANLAIPSRIATATLPIDLEVAKQAGVSMTAPQQWARLLGQMDLGSVRMRGIRAGDLPKLERKTVGRGARYHLLAILTKRNELVLPDRRFRAGDRRALQKYFEQLPAQAEYNAEERGRFGLTEKQFRLVYAELSQPLEFSTVAPRSSGSYSASEIVARIEKSLTVAVVQVENVRLRSGKPLAAELQNLSTGTALAYVLRREGLAVYPEQLPSQPLRLSIERYDSKRESWPVGWKPAVSARQSAPQLYKLRNIEINGFTLAQALTALQPALKIPVLFDDWVLRRRKIDPSQLQVSLPKKRTFLKSAVGKLLSQAHLAEELRVDEQGHPFLWVTQFGKNSRPASE